MAPAVEGEHVLLPVGYPVYGASQLHREISHGDVFREYATLLAVAAADVGSYHTDGVLGSVEGVG